MRPPKGPCPETQPCPEPPLHCPQELHTQHSRTQDWPAQHPLFGPGIALCSPIPAPMFTSRKMMAQVVATRGMDGWGHRDPGTWGRVGMSVRDISGDQSGHTPTPLATDAAVTHTQSERGVLLNPQVSLPWSSSSWGHFSPHSSSCQKTPLSSSSGPGDTL